MAGTFRCTIVTPESPVLDEEARYVSFPAWDGQVGVLSNRAPLLAKLGAGPLRVDLVTGGTRTYFVAGGFAQMKDNKLSILSDEAKPADQINLATAEAALREAQAVRGTSPAEAERKQRDMDRARGMIATAGKR